MNTISGFDKALGFYSEPKPRSVLPRFLSAIRTYWSATRDGPAAAHAYHALTTQGETHEAAVEKVFDQHLGGRRRSSAPFG